MPVARKLNSEVGIRQECNLMPKTNSHSHARTKNSQVARDIKKSTNDDTLIEQINTKLDREYVEEIMQDPVQAKLFNRLGQSLLDIVKA